MAGAIVAWFTVGKRTQRTPLVEERLPAGPREFLDRSSEL